jgi:hypothetical protein
MLKEIGLNNVTGIPTRRHGLITAKFNPSLITGLYILTHIFIKESATIGL